MNIDDFKKIVYSVELDVNGIEHDIFMSEIYNKNGFTMHQYKFEVWGKAMFNDDELWITYNVYNSHMFLFLLEMEFLKHEIDNKTFIELFNWQIQY